MSNTLTTQELYDQKRREYEDAQVELRVYNKQLADATKAFKDSLSAAGDAIYATGDDTAIAAYSELIVSLNKEELTEERLGYYLTCIQAIASDLDEKAREILNG